MIFFHVSGIIRHTLYSYKYIQIIKFITKIFIYIYSAVKTNSSKYVGFAFRVQNQIHVALNQVLGTDIDFVFSSLEYKNHLNTGRERE